MLLENEIFHHLALLSSKTFEKLAIYWWELFNKSEYTGYTISSSSFSLCCLGGLWASETDSTM